MDGTIAVVGAGQAGGVCALALRKFGFRGEIVVFGAEAEAPYERPPLSKEFLGGKSQQLTYVAKTDRWVTDDIELSVGTDVIAIDRSAKTLQISGRRDRQAYDRLILATGGVARKLPGGFGERICYLRDAADSRRIAEFSRSGGDALVIGAGAIGLEVAATLRQAGLGVTVIEAAEHVMARVLPKEAAAWLEWLHAENGVEIVTSSSVQIITSRADGVDVLLSGGRSISAQFCVVGIGIAADDALALSCGLDCEDGILVDERYRTVKDTSIFAIGDVARRIGHLRDESWTHAQNSAEIAARAILDVPDDSPLPTPYFWSVQFDRMLQVAGDVTGGHRRIQIAEYGFLYADEDDKAVGIVMLDGKRDFQRARKMVAARAPVASTEEAWTPTRQAAPAGKDQRS